MQTNPAPWSSSSVQRLRRSTRDTVCAGAVSPGSPASVPSDRLVLAWQLTREFKFDPDFETTVEVLFEERGDTTIVQFEHRDLERMGAGAVEQMEAMDGGWGMLLDLFKTEVERS